VGDYAPGTDEGWLRFEEEYRTYILAFASVAAEEGVDLFVIGTELDRTVRERPEYWFALIREIREVYPGALTYAANWDGAADMPFWGELDYIGVDAFFPLSDAALPGVSELVEAWQPVVRELAALCREYERPVLFAEYGYRSIDGAAGEQWAMPPERASDVPVNTAAQVNAYEALFQSWWDRPWFAGGFLWKWFPEDEARAERLRADYTPQHKPVEGLIREWYGEAGGAAAPPASAGDR